MEVVKTKAEAKQKIGLWKKQGLKIGFVPTMGYLHKGHLSLMELSKKRADKSVISIFVNPTQFGPSEDFERYPRDIQRDLELSNSVGVDLVFMPEVKEMYPEPIKTWVTVEDLTNNLCGKSRPGHFKGVATVVTKLFNIIQPDIAVFGQKDYQQVQVIKRMVRDLDIPVKIIMAPIVREKDGLAMSSRNTYLSKEERKSAICLFKALNLAKELIKEKGIKKTKELKDQLEKFIHSFPFTKIDYIFIGDPEELTETSSITLPTLVALAVYVGTTRLIDNEVIT